MAEITEQAMVGRAPLQDAAGLRVQTGASARGPALVPLTAIDVESWRALSERAVEPNGYYLPGWELAVNATAPGHTDASALAAWSDAAPAQLIGLLPVVSMWRACKVPMPALVSAHPYGTLCTPLIGRDFADEAVQRLILEARQAGARALILRETSTDGPAIRALMEGALREGLRPRVLQSHRRACLDATPDAETLLRDALGRKRLKELRRQRHRLAEYGPVRLEIARTPDEVAAALETFLKLEASGWKGKRGTALIQVAGDAAFIRCATAALAETGQCEIVVLRAGDTPVAASIVLRHGRRAFFFKLGIDERFAKFSPGVQLTLELTRHLCADPSIDSADSTATPDHPMIDRIWRGRLAIGDVLVPLKRNDPVVALIHATLIVRQRILSLARRALHLLRGRR